MISEGQSSVNNAMDSDANTKVEKITSKKQSQSTEKSFLSTPSLLDYAKKSYVSAAKSKMSSTPVPKSEASGGMIATPITKESTTPAVTPIRVPENSSEALRLMMGLAASSQAMSMNVRSPEQHSLSSIFSKSPIGTSPPSTQLSAGFSAKTADPMEKIRDFSQTFKGENRDSPPAVNIKPASSSQVAAFKQVWDQGSKVRDGTPKQKPSFEDAPMKLFSKSSDVGKISKPKQHNVTSKATVGLSDASSSTHGIGSLKGLSKAPKPVGNTTEGVGQFCFTQQSGPTMPSPGSFVNQRDKSGKNTDVPKAPESKARLQEERRDKYPQLTMGAMNFSKPVEKKRPHEAHVYDQSVTSHSRSPNNSIFSPANVQLSPPVYSQPSVKQGAGSAGTPQLQQLHHKQPASQQVSRVSPSPRSSPATPPRSSPGPLYSGLTLAQMQAQALQQQQQQQRASSGSTSSSSIWRKAEQATSRSPGPGSAFGLTAWQRSPEYNIPSQHNAGAAASAVSAASYPGIHMVDLSQAQQAHDIAASMRSPGSPAHSGRCLELHLSRGALLLVISL